MAWTKTYPRLRPVELIPTEQDGQPIMILRDPAGWAAGPLAVTPPALFIFSMLDGDNGPEQIQAAFVEQFGRTVPYEQLEQMIEQLDTAMYLDSARFTEHLQERMQAYRAAPTRVSPNPEALGAPAGELGSMLDKLLGETERIVPASNEGRLVGVVAPHLDYPRGQPCYADVYGLLKSRPPARRFVILGTNHFGQATSVVATSKDFETPLGITRTDRPFINDLAQRCEVDLLEGEFDHQREHSVELQVLMLQHIYGPDSFEIVPILCHDPCGPMGTGPYDGEGVDLERFGRELRDMVVNDPDTMMIVGADLSHVGVQFGDECDLNEAFLQEVETKDLAVLRAMQTQGHAALLACVTADENATRICSSGGLYTLRSAWDQARVELLRYHQARDDEAGCCVTCASMLLWA